MPMQLRHVVERIEHLAPPALAESWDKVGLHVGDPTQSISRVLLCVDLTEAVVSEALAWGAELILAYHPPIFQPLARLTPASWKHRALLTAVQKHVAIYSPHTALDAARDGITDWLCAGIGSGVTVPISARAPAGAGYRVSATVPAHLADEAANVAYAAGSRPHSEVVLTLEPTTLNPGKRARVALTTPSARDLADVIAKLRELLADHADDDGALPHEPEIDIVPLAPEPALPWQRVGAGRILTLDAPLSLPAFANAIKRVLGVKTIKLAAPRTRAALTPRGPHPGKITRVAVCPGAGGSLFQKVRDVDAYFTGEMRHHDALDAVQRGQVVALAGHTQTERPYLRTLRARLKKALDGAIAVRVSKTDRAPFRFV